jgi:histidyl-tRNA synthetase
MDKPTLPKGTRDFGPAQMAKRQFIFNIIRTVFQKYGFQPLETPAMENLETLTGKYGEEGDQLLFRILDNGDFLKEVSPTELETRNTTLVAGKISGKGLRYDLTVPFARYVVMNRGDIALPFKRYQIQPVWRADRPQRGRYREFFQCDADVVGTDSLVSEAEIVLMIKEVFSGLGLTEFTIKINHRGILSGLAEAAGANKNEGSLFVAIDKLDKIGEEKVADELRTRGFSDDNIKSVFDTLKISGSNPEKIQQLSERFADSEKGKKGLDDLGNVFKLIEAFSNGNRKPETRNQEPETRNQQPETGNIELDISLARGLSYYTGTIFEVKVNNVNMGSVSGGGRYDNLTQAFGSKEKLSGVGISFGIDRLYDVMEELKLFPKEATVSSKVLVAHFDADSLTYGLRICQTLRDLGIATEIYPDVSKLKKQLEYADKKEIPFVIVIGPDEIHTGLLSFKNLATGVQEKLTLEQIIEQLK